MTEPLRVVGSVDPAAVARAAVAARLVSLEEVVRFGDILEVVVQDEYTHDVIVTAATLPGSYLVFDTT